MFPSYYVGPGTEAGICNILGLQIEEKKPSMKISVKKKGKFVYVLEVLFIGFQCS